MPGPNIPQYRGAQLPPAAAGRDYSMADLLTADIPPEQLGQMILEQSTPDVLALLASILRNQKRNNGQYQPVPYSFSAYGQQRVLTQNPRRGYLMVQNVGSGDIYICFEDSSENVQDYSGDTQTLIVKQVRSLRIVGGGYFEPLVAPTNAITLFTLNAAAYGVVIEGQ